MSIEKTWDEINEGGDEDLSSLLHTGTLSKLPSHNPLQKIKSNLLANLIWCVVLSIGYIIIISYFRIWQVQVSLGIVLAFTLWALYEGSVQYKKLNSQVSPAGSLLHELKRHHQSISNWMKVQQQVGLFVYPISAAGGFMLGGVLGSGKSVATFLSKPAAQIALPICIVVLVPAGYYLARWMYKHSFGKHLAALQKNINDLEAEK
jgi:cation transporter-like permease